VPLESVILSDVENTGALSQLVALIDWCSQNTVVEVTTGIQTTAAAATTTTTNYYIYCCYYYYYYYCCDYYYCCCYY